MTNLLRLTFLAAMFGLAACDNDNDAVAPTNPSTPPPAAVTSQVQIIHASPDAPAVNVTLDAVATAALSGIDYTDSALASLNPGTYTVQVDGILPGSTTPVIGPVDLTFAADTRYIVAAVGGDAVSSGCVGNP